MHITLYSLAGALIMLGTGLMLTGVYEKYLYPVHRLSHEEAKLTGRRGFDPRLYLAIFKLLSFIALPVAGFLFGNGVLEKIFG